MTGLAHHLFDISRWLNSIAVYLTKKFTPDKFYRVRWGSPEKAAPLPKRLLTVSQPGDFLTRYRPIHLIASSCPSVSRTNVQGLPRPFSPMEARGREKLTPSAGPSKTRVFSHAR